MGYDGCINRAVRSTGLLKVGKVLLVKRVKGFVGLTTKIVGARSERTSYQVRMLNIRTTVGNTSTTIIQRVVSYVGAARTVRVLHERGLVRPIVRDIVGHVRFFLGAETKRRLRVNIVLFSARSNVLKGSRGTSRLLGGVRRGE